MDLKKLNSVYKRDYVSMVMREQEQTRGYALEVEDKVKNTVYDGYLMMLDFDEANTVWEQSCNNINKLAKERAAKEGVTKKQFNNLFTINEEPEGGKFIVKHSDGIKQV